MNLRVCGITVAAGMLLATSLMGRANAQVLGSPSQDVEKPLAIKIGAFLPTNGNAQHSGGSVQFTAGLDYALEKSSTPKPAIPSIYFDYEGGGRDGGHTDVYGLGVAIRSYGSAPGLNKTSPYIGAGIGVYNEDVKNAYSGASNTKTNLGGKIFVGEELSSGAFIEANYQILTSTAGVNPSGFGVQVGYRF